MVSDFFRRVIRKPPVLFPLVALFHVLMFLYSVWIYHTQPFPSVDWIGPLWLLMYTLSWIFICDLRKWAAFLYIGLTILDIILRFTLKSQTSLALYTHTFFPIDILFCFFVLFWFRKFD